MKREIESEGVIHKLYIQVTTKCKENPKAKSGPGRTAKSDLPLHSFH